MKKAVLGILLFAGVFIASASWMAMRPNAMVHQVTVEIPPGTPTREIADRLAEAGAVASRWHFLAARLFRPRTPLQAGLYGFEGEDGAAAVLDRIARGDILTTEITIPEGYNIFDIAAVVGRSGLASEQEFLAAARDPSIIRDIAPAATSLEGYLFPDTYRVARSTTAAGLIGVFTRRFRAMWRRAGGSGDVHQTVTLASLVEKETGRSDDRATVASVYTNRLKRGMKLDCDPTTIYAAMLEGRWRGTIYRSDLDNPHPYNTYRHAGLPPGPIASPGEASIRAALQPAQTPYLFFVAQPDGSGRHVFSETMAEHARAVAVYRKGVHAGKQKGASSAAASRHADPAR